MPDPGAAWAFLKSSALIASPEEVQCAVRRIIGKLRES